jgi:protein tyrosine phosphatase
MLEVLEAIKSGAYNNVWGELKGDESNSDMNDIAERFHDYEKPRFSIFGTVRKIKEQRFGMVKTQKQYEFLYAYMDHYITLNKLQ